ncbi:hypothetical protein KDL44_01575 [bacterium]|nr:hypothetical protein [bacterium]
MESEAPELVPGEVYAARVTRVDSGLLELELGDSCLVAESAYSFRVGDRLTLRYIGRHSGMIRFALAPPSPGSREGAGMLRTLALAVGADDSADCHTAMDLLLRHSLPLQAENVNTLAELLQRNSELGPGLLLELSEFWSAGLRPAVGMLHNYFRWRNSGQGLCALIREAAEFERLRNPLSVGGGLEHMAIIGEGGEAADQRSTRLILRLLYGGANDPMSLDQLCQDNDLRRNPALSALLDVLGMQCMRSAIDSPRMEFSIPLAGRIGDCDARLSVLPLGQRHYRQRFSCILTLMCRGEQQSSLQVHGDGDGMEFSMLSGDGSLATALRYAVEPRITSPPRRLPEPTDPALLEDGYPGFAQRLPLGIPRLLARLSAVLQERC